MKMKLKWPQAALHCWQGVTHGTKTEFPVNFCNNRCDVGVKFEEMYFRLMVFFLFLDQMKHDSKESNDLNVSVGKSRAIKLQMRHE